MDVNDIFDPNGTLLELATVLKSKLVLTDQRKLAFLRYIAENGQFMKACAVAGVSSFTVQKCRREDQDFADAETAAYRLYQEKIETNLQNIALDGVEEAVYFQGERIDTRRKIIPAITLAHAKRHIEQYRDKLEVSASEGGGVLVIPGVIKDSAPGPDSIRDGRSTVNKTWAVNYGDDGEKPEEK